MVSTCVSCVRVCLRGPSWKQSSMWNATQAPVSLITQQWPLRTMFGISCSHLVSYPCSHVTPWEKVMKNDWITFLMQENILPITSEIIDHILQKAYYSIKFLNFSYTLSPVHEDNSFKLGCKNGFQTRDALILKLWYIW